MKKVPILSITSAAISIGLACSLALGQASRTANAWDFEFTRYLWMPELDADVQLGGLAYQLIDTPVREGGGQRLTSEPLGGVRYAYLKQELRLDVAVAGIGGIGTTFGGSEEWVEPFVGLTFHF